MNEVLGAQVAKKTRITLCFVGLLAAMAEMGTAPNALAGPKSYDINVLLEEPHPFAAAPNTSAPAYIPADQIRPRARVPQQVPYRQPTVRTAAERSARDRMCAQKAKHRLRPRKAFLRDLRVYEPHRHAATRCGLGHAWQARSRGQAGR